MDRPFAGTLSDAKRSVQLSESWRDNRTDLLRPCNHPPEALAVDVSITGCSGQTAVAEQLLQFPDIAAAFVEQQIGGAMP